MKIRTQSIILMAGILLMPAVLVSLFVVAERVSVNAREANRFKARKPKADADLAPKGGAPRSKKSSSSKLPPNHPSSRKRAALKPDDIILQFFGNKPTSMEMAVAGPNGRIVRSDIDGMPVGANFSSAILEAYRRLGPDRVLSFGFAPQMPPGYSAVTSMPRSGFFPMLPRNDFIRLGVLILVGILAFAAAMCVLIVRAITRSVLSLESATKRVAAGELETPISVEGSNEIASLSRSLDSLRIVIREDQLRRARFIMGISHDLKTPLALIKGYSEALEEELGGGPEALDHLGIIQAKADQLEGMIDDLLEFERVDTGDWKRERMIEVDIGSFLRAFAKRVEADAALLEREIRSKIDIPEGVKVLMDERLATRALENLVNNAMRYTSAGDTICVEARAGEGGAEGPIVIVVADEGPGISPEDLPHIFEPFYRGSSSRREEGMGLGLSIVKTIIESHGWSIEARRDEGEGGHKGAVFVITIPRGVGLIGRGSP